MAFSHLHELYHGFVAAILKFEERIPCKFNAPMIYWRRFSPPHRLGDEAALLTERDHKWQVAVLTAL